LHSSISIPLAEIDIGLLADQVGVSATDTLDLGHGVHDLLLSYKTMRFEIEQSGGFFNVPSTLVLTIGNLLA
jgi:hypothetical protein